MMTFGLWIVLALVQLKAGTTGNLPVEPTDGFKTPLGVRRVFLDPPRTGSERTRPTTYDRGFESAFGVRLEAERADVERGRQTFLRVGCYECHGREAQGASTGPRLGPNPMPFPGFARAVRTPRNEMPPYSAKILGDDELADVYAFVSARPRPHQLPR